MELVLLVLSMDCIFSSIPINLLAKVIPLKTSTYIHGMRYVNLYAFLNSRWLLWQSLRLLRNWLMS